MKQSDNESNSEYESLKYYAPWEKTVDRVLTPFEAFIHRETTSGFLLMGCALLALVCANSVLAESYQHLVHTKIGLHFGDWGIEKTLHHWVNDGLMALFFFVVGLELKREMLVGELADPKQAILPILAAVGGMVVPALVYYSFNAGTEGAHGWGIPMATDIAFAIGALVLLGSRVPKALITFLVALAIVDDLGAVVVIAFFYTEQLMLGPLGIGCLLIGVLVFLNVAGVRKPLPYFLIGSLLWFALLKSGVHATLAGVITALIIPARPKYDPVLFSQRVKELIGRFDKSYRPGESIMKNSEQRAVLQSLESSVHAVETPLQRFEHSMHLPVAFLVIPIFAFINAGIPFELSTLGDTLSHPVAFGVIAGLIAGKFIGVAGICWIALKMGICRLPEGATFAQVAGVALLSGIGFTMSIFVAELGFVNQPELLLMAKTGVLVGSLIAGIAGYMWLIVCTKKPAETP